MGKPEFDLILGTAGHIDHGKSALVKALTGTDPDRLAEEKRRGITIQLGFAQIELPDGRTIGVIDVPGHERFVRQMIAGATGIDVALLVIAADDGVMPQTIEHAAVLEALGIDTCVIALTKADLVDGDWLDFVEEDVRQRLSGGVFQDAPIVAVSSKTGEGIERLRQALQDACRPSAKVDHGDVMRLPVDRVFTIKGAGTVVTGTLWSGEVRPGDTVEALPRANTSRIRSVQVHGEAREVAKAGNRVALNLPDFSTDDIDPGDMLVAPNAVSLSDRFDCRLFYADTAQTGKPLSSGARMHIAHGTREVRGRVLFCDEVGEISSGESVLAQVRLEDPLPVRYADRFVIRSYSPTRVEGGGTVLAARPRRRTRLKAGESEMLASLEGGDVGAAAIAAVSFEPYPAPASRIAEHIGVNPQRIIGNLDAAVQDGRLVAFDDGTIRYYSTPADKQRLFSKAERTLIDFHAENPVEAGMSVEALRRAAFPQMPSGAFSSMLDDMAHAHVVVVRDGLAGHPSAQGSALRALENAADALSKVLASQGMMPEPLEYLGKHAGLDAPLASKAVAFLVENGRAYRLDGDLIFDSGAIDTAIAAVRAFLEANGTGTVAQLKDAMGTSRKYAVPLLERFDFEGITKRNGDVRSLC